MQIDAYGSTKSITSLGIYRQGKIPFRLNQEFTTEERNKCKYNWYTWVSDASGSLHNKEYAYNTGDLGLIPGSGRSPGEGNDNPLQYSYLENPWTKEPGGLQFMGFARVGHSLVTKPSSSHEFILYIHTDMAFKELHRHSKIKLIKN